MKSEVLLLFSVFALMSFLPFLPALLQLFAPDASAYIDIPHDHSDDPRHFSRRLKNIVDKLEHGNSRLVQVSNEMRLQDGHWPVTHRGQWANSPWSTESRIAVVAASTELPPTLRWLGDMLSLGDLEVPQDTLIRALRCEGRCLLHPNATVLRWLDAQSLFVMGPGRLPRRTTASRTISLSTGIRFDRMHAPEIEVLPHYVAPQDNTPTKWHAVPDDIDVWRLEPDEELLSGHKVCHDDVFISQNSAVVCDIVCHGDLHVGMHAHVQGNLKVRGDLFLHEGARITGHVLCSGNITLDNACQIDGVMTAAKHLHIAPGCELGTNRTHTSLIAHTITLHSGVRIHGQVWARHMGTTHA